MPCDLPHLRHCQYLFQVLKLTCIIFQYIYTEEQRSQFKIIHEPCHSCFNALFIRSVIPGLLLADRERSLSSILTKCLPEMTEWCGELVHTLLPNRYTFPFKGLHRQGVGMSLGLQSNTNCTFYFPLYKRKKHIKKQLRWLEYASLLFQHKYHTTTVQQLAYLWNFLLLLPWSQCQTDSSWDSYNLSPKRFQVVSGLTCSSLNQPAVYFQEILCYLFLTHGIF